MSMRLKLFEDAKRECSKLQVIYPSNNALLSISHQIDYLIGLETNPNGDRSRLREIIIGVLTAREIELLDENAANIFYKVAAESKKM